MSRVSHTDAQGARTPRIHITREILNTVFYVLKSGCPRRFLTKGFPRTYSWLRQNRRMSKDHERICTRTEAFMYAAMIRLMVSRLAPAYKFPNTFSTHSGQIRQDRGTDTIVAGLVVREEGGLAYEIEAVEMGWRLGLHASDWENLLGLAYRYGWRPSAGLDHYLRGGTQIVPHSEAQSLARVLEEALRNLPPERRKEVRLAGALGGSVYEVPRPRPDADYERYFAWERRWIVEEVMRFCQQGALEIHPM